MQKLEGSQVRKLTSCKICANVLNKCLGSHLRALSFKLYSGDKQLEILGKGKGCFRLTQIIFIKDSKKMYLT